MDITDQTHAALAAALAATAATSLCYLHYVYRHGAWLAADERVVVFSRFPQPGNTKTRLIPAVGADGASFLQRRMTEELLGQLRAWGRSAGRDPRAGAATLVEMRHYGGSRADMDGWLGRRFSGGDALFMRPQMAGGGLGNKIAEAFSRAFDEGAQRVCVVGCDIPQLGAAEIEADFAALSGGGADMVLGPALDGGYYLVALSRDHLVQDNTEQPRRPLTRALLEELFDGEAIDWGTETVRGQQLTVAARLGIGCTVLEKKLSDVDEVEELPAAEAALGLGLRELKRPRVAVVIPTLNEAGGIAACVRQLVEGAARCPAAAAAAGEGGVSSSPRGSVPPKPRTLGRSTAVAQAPPLLYLSQIVISDGGSLDDTMAIVRSLTAEAWWPTVAVGTDPLTDDGMLEPLPLVVIETAADAEKGRGAQLSRGTDAAAGEVLLFLHADTRLPPSWDATAIATLLPPGVAAGAFRFGIDPESVVDAGASWLARAQLSVLTWGTNLRAVYRELPYGDQALFMLSSTLQRVGGWRSDHPLLEDLELVRRLTATEGRVVLADDSASTSARRFLRHGVMYIMACNQYVLARYALGESPTVLAAWYYGKDA